MPNGFTLIEVLVTLGLFGVVLSFSLIENMSSLTYHFERSETAHLSTLNHAAQGSSMRHICRSEFCTHAALHGVQTEPKELILFEGDSFSTRTVPQDWFLPRSKLLSSTTTETIIYYANGSSSIDSLP